MSTTLGTAFIANNSGNEILFCSSPDGVHWSADTEVHQSSKAAPSMVAFKFNYLLAFLANNSSNEILACSSTDGVNWSNDIQVHQSSKDAPSLAVFNNTVWMAFIANNSGNEILICSSPDGVRWTTDTEVHQSTKAAPSMAVFNNRLWIAFIANNNSNNILVCSSADGRNWSSDTLVGQSSKTAPSLTVFNNRLWMAFLANNSSNEILVCSSADGVHWSPDTQVHQSSHSAPSLTAQNGELCLAFVANNSSNELLFCTSPDGVHWSSDMQMHQSSKTAPSLTAAVVYTGTVRPLYQVLTVLYAPPGTKGGNSKSLVDYGSGSATGTTTSVSSSFEVGANASVSAGIGIVSVDTSFTYSHTTTDASSVDVKKSQNYDLKVFGPPVDGINHDEDQFILWLNPLLNVTTDPMGNVQWTLGVAGPTMLIQSVLVAELKNPASMRPGVKQALTNAGLTEADYAQILTTNPFASANVAIDPDRFLLCSQSCPYEPPFEANGPVDTTTFVQSNAVTTVHTKTVQDKYGVSVKVSGGIGSILKLSVGGSLQWTNTSSSASSASSTQSAAFTIAGPSFGYAGPTNVLVYWDTIYSSFMFALPTDLPGAFGNLTDGAGLPLAKKAVTLSVGQLTLTTFTNSRGDYSFYSVPTGQGKVSVEGREFAVGVGQHAPKAMLRIT